jgi:regulatory protein YycI of two-component signal transduction system YycFG
MDWMKVAVIVIIVLFIMMAFLAYAMLAGTDGDVDPYQSRPHK